MIPTPKFKSLWFKAEGMARRHCGYEDRYRSDVAGPTALYMKLITAKVNALRAKGGVEAYTEETIKGKTIGEIENEIEELK